MDALLQLVVDVKADLLVVGNKGLNTLSGRLLGSVPADAAPGPRSTSSSSTRRNQRRAQCPTPTLPPRVGLPTRWQVVFGDDDEALRGLGEGHVQVVGAAHRCGQDRRRFHDDGVVELQSFAPGDGVRDDVALFTQLRQSARRCGIVVVGDDDPGQPRPTGFRRRATASTAASPSRARTAIGSIPLARSDVGGVSVGSMRLRRRAAKRMISAGVR